MNRLEELEILLAELKGIDRMTARKNFAVLFQRGCTLLELDDEAAAEVFDTSRPTISRWRRGKMFPPAAWLILRYMGERVSDNVKRLRNVTRVVG